MSVAMMLVVYDFRGRGDSDLPTPLLSNKSTRVLGGPPGLLAPSSSSNCGAQHPWVAPKPMMSTTSGFAPISWLVFLKKASMLGSCILLRLQEVLDGLDA